MFHINRPILATAALDERSHETLLRAHNLAYSYNIELHVLPKIFAVRPLFPHFHLSHALKLAKLEAGVRGALLERIQKVTGRVANQAVITIEQGKVHAGILRAAESIDGGALVVGGKVDRQGLPILGPAAELGVRHAHCPVLVARASSQGRVLSATTSLIRPSPQLRLAPWRHVAGRPTLSETIFNYLILICKKGCEPARNKPQIANPYGP